MRARLTRVLVLAAGLAVGHQALAAQGVPSAASSPAPQSAPPSAPKATRPFDLHPGATAGAVGEARSVRGRVVRGTESSARPLGGAWVTLHRVGTDHAAPLDSLRTDAAGAYAFRYRTSGDAKALYFVSTTYAGIAYFTAPLRERVVSGDDATLVAYDTTSAAVPIRVRARHLVVSAPDASGTRTIVEIFELSNDSSVTRVARSDADVHGDTGVDTSAVWESGLLDGARDARIGQGDFAADVVRFSDGRVRVFAPFSPGLKQVSFSYTVPAAATDLSVMLASPADVMEVLIEDPLGRAEGGGVVASGPTTVNGRSFARFLGQDVRANSVVQVHAPSRGPSSATQVRVLLIVAALGAALLVGLARYMMRRPVGSHVPAVAGDVDSIRARLAALDASFANLGSPTADERADHWQARAHLSQQLTTALAREQGLA